MKPGSTPPRSFPRRAAAFFAKAAFACVLTVLLLELGLRLVGFRPVAVVLPKFAPGDVHADPQIAAAQHQGWLPTPSERRRIEPLPDGSPGSFEIRRNRLSLREDVETPLDPPTGVVRVLCLGDSHTDGVCDNVDSYPHTLQRLWNSAEHGVAELSESNVAAPSSANENGDENHDDDKDADDDTYEPATLPLDRAARLEVLNAGWATSSPYQQLWAFEQVYRRLRPQIVCVGFYAGNDLVDLMRSADIVHLERQGERFVHAEPNRSHDATQATPSRLESIKGPFRRYSATYAALTQVRWLRGAVVDAAGDDYRNRLEQAHGVYPGAVWQDLNQAYYFRHHPEQWPEAFAQQRFILQRFAELSREDGFILIVAIIPALRQIHPETDAEAFDRTIATLRLEPADVATDERACDAVKSLATELRIPCLDLCEPLRTARHTRPDTPLYYRVDQHLNVAGNQVVAQALREYLAGAANSEQGTVNSEQRTSNIEHGTANTDG